jgi:hypothetical protein
MMTSTKGNTLEELTGDLKRFAALPPKWQTEKLRAVIEAQVAYEETAREFEAARQAAVGALDAELAELRPDLTAAASAAARVAALEVVAGHMPPAPTDTIAFPEALGAAQMELRHMAASCEIIPPAYVEERERWRSLGKRALAVEPPVARPEDLEAAAAFQKVVETGQALAANVDAWEEWVRAGTTDRLSLLGSAAGLLAQLSEAIETAGRVSEGIVAINQSRHRAGLTWSA